MSSLWFNYGSRYFKLILNTASLFKNAEQNAEQNTEH